MLVSDLIFYLPSDILVAENAMKNGFHEWACFAAQQAGEKAAV